ncbi:hypothetical protein TNCV_4429701 [Trichonephila clavipes]|nr:hypothetical protein TNCV_4429701 [Trichonephila clavipes]
MGSRTRGRPPTRWIDDVENDLKTLNIKNWQRVAAYRWNWRKRAVEAAKTCNRRRTSQFLTSRHPVLPHPSPNYHNNVRTLSLDNFSAPSLHGGSSVALGLDPATLRPRRRIAFIAPYPTKRNDNVIDFQSLRLRNGVTYDPGGKACKIRLGAPNLT